MSYIQKEITQAKSSEPQQYKTRSEWLGVLGEEFGQACKSLRNKDDSGFREDLVHIAAVAVQIIEAIDGGNIVEEGKHSLNDLGIVTEKSNPIDLIKRLRIPDEIKEELAKRIYRYGEHRATYIKNEALDIVVQEQELEGNVKNIYNNIENISKEVLK